MIDENTVWLYDYVITSFFQKMPGIFWLSTSLFILKTRPPERRAARAETGVLEEKSFTSVVQLGLNHHKFFEGPSTTCLWRKSFHMSIFGYLGYGTHGSVGIVLESCKNKYAAETGQIAHKRLSHPSNWKIFSSNSSISPGRGKHKKLKPPPRKLDTTYSHKHILSQSLQMLGNTSQVVWVHDFWNINTFRHNRQKAAMKLRKEGV